MRLLSGRSPNRRLYVRVLTSAMLCLALSDAAFAAQPSIAPRFRATVVTIQDGDSLTVIDERGTRVEVRLYGVDAPERDQPSGPEATQFLANLIAARPVQLYAGRFERNGRLVARITVQDVDVSLALLRAGFAWHSTGFSQDPLFADAERTARQARAGLWQADDPTPPWVFRRRGRQPAARPAAITPTGPFRGNAGSFVYHAEGCRHYDCANCTRRFATTAAALAAGYRPHSACVHGSD